MPRKKRPGQQVVYLQAPAQGRNAGRNARKRARKRAARQQIQYVPVPAPTPVYVSNPKGKKTRRRRRNKSGGALGALRSFSFYKDIKSNIDEAVVISSNLTECVAFCNLLKVYGHYKVTNIAVDYLPSDPQAKGLIKLKIDPDGYGTYTMMKQHQQCSKFKQSMATPRGVEKQTTGSSSSKITFTGTGTTATVVGSAHITFNVDWSDPHRDSL